MKKFAESPELKGRLDETERKGSRKSAFIATTIRNESDEDSINPGKGAFMREFLSVVRGVSVRALTLKETPQKDRPTSESPVIAAATVTAESLRESQPT